MPKLEQVLLAAVSLVFLPMVLYSAYMAYLACGEGERLARAPLLVAGAGVAGTFYRVDGEVAGGLSPKEFPAIHDVLQLRAQKQSRSDTLTANWVDEQDAAAQTARAEGLKIAGVPFELNDSSRVVAPVREAEQNETPVARWKLHYRTVAAGERFALFGYYEKGAVRDGTYDRVLLVAADQVEATITAVGAAGRTKAIVLGAVAAVMAALGALSAKAAVRGSKGRRGYGQG